MDIANYLARITEFQETITPNAKAVPVSIYTQGDYPYWLNRVTSINSSRSSVGVYRARYDISIQS